MLDANILMLLPGCCPVSPLTDQPCDDKTEAGSCRARVTVANKLGLHIRPSRKLAALAMKFDAKVEVRNGDRTAMADSQLDLLMLLASKDAELEIIAAGKDAQPAIDAMIELFEQRFGED